jgi:LETM1 and EF-hand domain-containing protein 1
LTARQRYAGALGAAATGLRLNSRNFPSQVTALAILVPKRGYATEQSTNTSGPSNLPPPGFNAEQAKNPISVDQAQPASAKANQDTNPKGEVSVQSQNVQSTSKESDLGIKSVAEDKDKKAVEEPKKESKKLTIGQKIKKEIQHYWDGTKLLATEVRISSRLALKMAGGYELSRREHRQVGFT